MRLVVLLVLGFYSHALIAQLPEFEADTDAESLKPWKLIQERASNHEEYVVFTADSYWTKNEQVYFLFLRTEKKWSLKKFTLKTREGKKTRYRSKKLNLSQNKFKDFLRLLNELDFWRLRDHELNRRQKTSGPDSKNLYQVNDGATYSFFARNKDKFKIIESYAPDSFQDMVFTEDRAQFIKARNALLKLISKR